MARQAAVPAGVPPIFGFLLALGVLYFARGILIPLALALLCAFLLSPIVKRLEQWRVPRVPAVILVLLVSFGVIGSIGWVVTNQLLAIVEELPRYRENVHQRVAAIEAPGAFTKLMQNLEDLGKEFSTTSPARPPVAAPRSPAKSARASEPSEETSPTPVQVVAPPPNALQSLRNVAEPLLGPLGTSGLVVVFTVFMLVDREDLRNRLLRLIGERQIYRTTKALDDAAQRVSTYLSLQFLVNAAFGAVAAFGLFLIGVPSFLLWGVLAMLFRFLPYVGTLIATLLPFLLAIATGASWHEPLLVIALFVVIETVTGNVIEPMLYGAHTGISAVAILAAALVWTTIWGPVGLLLSTPLTVCLGVMGRYSQHLQFLSILLGDEPVLNPEALFYQRLLALDQQDALAMAEGFLRERPLIELYDEIIVPALAMAERDRHGGQLEPRREEFVVQSIYEFVAELADHDERATGKRKRGSRFVAAIQETPETKKGPNDRRVFCLAAHDAADEVTAAMLAQLAGREGYPALAFPPTDSPGELLEALAPQLDDVVCVSATPPLAVTRARAVGQAVRERFPDVCLLIGLWRHPAASTKTVERLEQSTGAVVVTSLAAALAEVRGKVAEELKT